MSVILVLRWQRQEDHKFEGSLGYIGKTLSQNQTNINKATLSGVQRHCVYCASVCQSY
jgi:hypothetical protein